MQRTREDAGMVGRECKPRAHREETLAKEIAGGETVVYDQRTHEAHCLNPTAAVVWRECDGTKTVSDVAAAIGHSLGTPCDDNLVLLSLEELRRVGLLEEYEPIAGVSRRDLLKRVGPGMAAAALVPAVLSIVAPTPASAGTGLPSGARCASGAQCASGVCLPDNTCQ